MSLRKVAERELAQPEQTPHGLHTEKQGCAKARNT